MNKKPRIFIDLNKDLNGDFTDNTFEIVVVPNYMVNRANKKYLSAFAQSHFNDFGRLSYFNTIYMSFIDESRKPSGILNEKYCLFDIGFLYIAGNEKIRTLLPENITRKIYISCLRLQILFGCFVKMYNADFRLNPYKASWLEKTLNLDCFLYPEEAKFTKEDTLLRLNKLYSNFTMEFKEFFDSEIYLKYYRQDVPLIKGYLESLKKTLKVNLVEKPNVVLYDEVILRYLMYHYWGDNYTTNPCKFNDLQHKQLVGYFRENLKYIILLLISMHRKMPDFKVTFDFLEYSKSKYIGKTATQLLHEEFSSSAFTSILDLLNSFNIALIEQFLSYVTDKDEKINPK